MRNKRLLIGAIMLLAVGFASVSTVLYINGSAKVGVDSSFSNDVVFTKAQTATVDGSEKGGTARISADGKTITFATGDLAALGDTSTIDFAITNFNIQYGVNASISCVANDGDASNYADYVTVTTGNSTYSIDSAATVSDTLTVTLKKSALGGDGNGISIGFSCTINGTAVEETSTAAAITRTTASNQDTN